MHKLHPYIIYTLRELSDDNFDTGIKFCEFIHCEVDDIANILPNICFRNKCSVFSKCKCPTDKFFLYWSDGNPHIFRRHAQCL